MNLLVINLKGGAAKTTNSSIIACYLPGSVLLEIDKINRSDVKIDSNGFYKSKQIDFQNETSKEFLEFENFLIEEGIKIIDVGAIKLEIFHEAMKTANLYDTIDLLIIPAMDGSDDFTVAMDYLESVKDLIDPSKIMFSFNRFNEHEYTDIKEQFDSFFNNAEAIKSKYNIDLNDSDNYYVLKDSKAIKQARKLGRTIRSLVDQDLDKITQEQRMPGINRDTRMELTKRRTLVNSAKKFYENFIESMMEKIKSKLAKKISTVR